MRTLLVICLAVLVIGLGCAEGKVFSECALVKELLKHGISKNDMANWICLIKSESSFNTKATHKNTDGSIDYGLFQINNRYWCNDASSPGKSCHVTCKALLADNIGAAVKCAKLIKSKMGFNAWVGWKNKCHGHALPDVKHCY